MKAISLLLTLLTTISVHAGGLNDTDVVCKENNRRVIQTENFISEDKNILAQLQLTKLEKTCFYKGSSQVDHFTVYEAPLTMHTLGTNNINGNIKLTRTLLDESSVVIKEPVNSSQIFVLKSIGKKSDYLNTAFDFNRSISLLKSKNLPRRLNALEINITSIEGFENLIIIPVE